MNKKLLVLVGIMSVLSVNVMAEADMRTTVGGLNNIMVDETENENGQKELYCWIERRCSRSSIH